MNSGSNKKSNFLGDTVESKYSFLDLGKQFDYDKQKGKKVMPTSTKDTELQKDNVKQHMMYSGGFKMTDFPNKTKKSKGQEKRELEEQLKRKEKEEKKFDHTNYFAKKNDIYSKLGIRQDEVEEKNVDPNNELDQLQQELEREKEEEENNRNQLNYVDYNFKFGINKDDFYSTDDPSVQAQFREKLLGEIEHKVDKLHSKRDLLSQRKDTLKIIEKKQKMKISRDAEEQLTEKQKQALYKNVDDDVDDLIHQKWRNKNPDLNQVENVIDKHRQKMKELEQMYYQKKLNQEQSSHLINSQPMYMEDEVLNHLVEGKVDLDINHKKSFRTLNNKLTKAAKYTHRQLQDNDYEGEEEEDELTKQQMVGSFNGDMYDFEYMRNKRKDKKDYEQIKQDEEMEIIMPKRPPQKQIFESSPKRNQPTYQGGLAYLSDTSQSIQLQKIDRNRGHSNEKQKIYNRISQKVEQPEPIPNKKFAERDDQSLDKKKQQTLFNERDRKLQILREEMSQIDKLMQEPGVGVKKVYIQPSEKAIENVTHVPVEKQIYQHKYEEYLVDKKIKENTDGYFRKLSKPEFERVKSAKSFEKYKKLHPESDQDFTITDRPIELKKTYEDIVKDEDQAHIQQYSEQIEIGKRSVEEKRMKNLYTRIISDSKQSLNRRKQKDDEFIIKFLFMQIDTVKSGFISSQEIFDSLKVNKDAIVYFDLCIKTLFADLDKFKTSRKGLFTIQEFSEFIIKQNEMSKKTLQSEKKILRQQLQLEENPNLLHKLDKLKDKNELFLLYEKDPVNTYGTCVLNEAKLDVLREIFSELDTYSDYIVKRLDLIKEIQNSEKIQKIITYPAVKIPIVNRKVSLQSILEQIEKEYTLADDQQQKSKEYISWNQFFEYFKNYQKPNFILEHEISSSEEAKQFDISEDYLLLIQDIFDMIPRISNALDFVATADFIIAAKKDPQIRSIQTEVVRAKSQETGLGQEDLSQTLDRILSDGGDYIQWHEVKLFFSRRGKPFSDEFSEEIPSDLKKEENYNQSSKIEKVTFKNMQGGISPKKHTQVLEYDDDNQYYDENSQQGKKYDMFEQQKKVTKPNVQDEIAKLRLDGNYDSEDQDEEIDYMRDIQEGSEDDDLDGPQYNQLKQLDYMKNGGIPKKQKRTAEEAIQDHYSKKRVLMKPSSEDQEIKEEINEFDKHYKELLKRQKEAQLGPLESLQQKQQLEDPVKYGILKHTAVDYDKYFGQLIKHKAIHEKEKISLTVPKPFQFDSREATKSKSIYQIKKDQYLQEVMNRDEEELKKRFKANPIPTTTKVPMFNNIMEKNKEKREKVRQESIKMLQESEQPFSFYDKDIQKREEKKQKIVESVSNEMKTLKQKTFKANEVPASSKVDMIKQMEQEREENRKKRIEERKEEQLKGVKEFSRLAGASEQWKESIKKRETSKTWEEEKCTFAPKVNKGIPETSKKQTIEAVAVSVGTKMKAVSAFTGLLNKKPQIEAEPFDFQPAVHKPTNREYMDDYNNSIKADKLKPSNLLARLAPSMKKQSQKQIEETQQEEEQDNEEQVQGQDDEEEQHQEQEQNEEGEEDAQSEKQVPTKQTNTKLPSMNNIQKKQPSMVAIDKEKKTTKAEQLLMKTREEEKKKKLEEEQKKKKEQEEREKKLKDRAGEVRDKFGDPRSAKQAQEEMEKQKLKERQEIAKQQKQDYQQQIKDMENRVKSKQLLTEQKHHGSNTLDKYRKMKPSETKIDSQNQINQQQQEIEEMEDTKEQKGNKKNTILDLHNISGIDTKKNDNAEDNYDNEFDNNKDEIEEIQSPHKKNDFDEISD